MTDRVSTFLSETPEHSFSLSVLAVAFPCLPIPVQVEKGFQPLTKAGQGAWFPLDIPCSDAAKDLLSRLLTKDVAARLTAAEVLRHPWIRAGSHAAPVPILRSVVQDLRRFHIATKMKQAVLSVCTELLSHTELEELRALFRELDTDGDG